MNAEKPTSEIDLSAIEYNLSLTANERLEQHQASLETVIELEKAHRKLYEKPESASKSTPQRQD